MTERITPRNDSFFSSLIKDSFKMNESFKTDPSLATSARAAKESGSYLCASNVTPTAVRFIVSVFLCLLCSCRMSSTQMTCSHFRKNRPKKRQKTAGCRSRIISKNRPVPIFGRSTGASLVVTQMIDSGRRRREPVNIQNTFNQINKHKWKTAAPHGRLPHTKHKLKPRPGPLSSSTVVTPHLTLPKLLRGTRDRWAVQVSFITNYSTGLAPFPRLSAPPHSPHTPIAPRRPGGTHETALYSPPPPSPGGSPSERPRRTWG